MEYREEELPQVQQLPAALRKSVNNVAELRQSFPINGTTLFGHPRPLSPRRRVRYLQRKAREQEAKARARARSYKSETQGQDTGSGGRRVKLENNSSDGAFDSGVSTLPVPQEEGTCHKWSMSDPSTTAVLVDHHGRPKHPRTALNHPTTPPPAPSGTHGLHGPSHSDSGAPVYLHFQYTTAATSSSSAESSSSAGNTPRYSPTTSDRETYYRGSPTRSLSSQPQTVWIEEQGTSAAPEPFAHLPPSKPELSTAQGAAWSEDRFVAVYQSYFIRWPSDTCDSISPALAPGPIVQCTGTPKQVNFKPEAQVYVSTASMFDGNTAGEWRPRVPRPYNSDSSTHSRGGVFLDSSIPPAMVEPVAPINREQWEALEMAATAGVTEPIAAATHQAQAQVWQHDGSATQAHAPHDNARHLWTGTSNVHPVHTSSTPLAYTTSAPFQRPQSARISTSVYSELAHVLVEDHSIAPSAAQARRMPLKS
ncbi:hypothetical protein V8D89_001920 [Ganoderma adspersum]